MSTVTIDASYQKKLISGANALGVTLEESALEKLSLYLGLMAKWNRTYNLSAIRDMEQMVSKHLLDSLAVVPYLRDQPSAQRCIDVGTGGGLPGIPLAIMFPERQFTLLDSNGKKTRFLFHVAQELDLQNLEVQHTRVEHFKPVKHFDIVISRAFASLKNMTEGCAHLIHDQGQFWAMKGALAPTDLNADINAGANKELKEIAQHYKVEAHHRLDVPNVEGERCLVVISPKPLPL